MIRVGEPKVHRDGSYTRNEWRRDMWTARGTRVLVKQLAPLWREAARPDEHPLVTRMRARG